MNAITGGFVWGIVIFIAIYMLLHSRKAKKEAHTLHRSESKYFHTAAKMDEALLALLAKKRIGLHHRQGDLCRSRRKPLYFLSAL